MNVPLLFASLSGMTAFSGYVVYNVRVCQGASAPNATSWALWTAAAILNLATYFDMTGDLLKIIPPLVTPFGCFFTFVFAVYKKNYGPLSPIEWAAFGIGVMSALLWWRFHSSMYANMVLQTAIIAGFVPTYKSVFEDPLREDIIAWILFSLAYLFLCVTVFFRWSGNIPELVFPLLGLTLHSGLASFIAVLRRKNKNN